ncbi:uncharacterized protein LOC143287872 [Babylonia areolata]|uniref:uncharacterized protein LOC143287872 n=1 Tax=Babylonia areolata TaxID=304850 RepID=UPI003FD04F59
MAPEVLIPEWKKSMRECARDCYSLGVMALHMLLGMSHLPYGVGFGDKDWADVTREELRTSLVEGMKTGVAHIPHTLNTVTRDFISELLLTDCSKRLGTYGAYELKTHLFFKGVNWKDVAEKRLQPPDVPAADSEQCRLSDDKLPPGAV